MIKFSIITTVYNQENYIKFCIESVLSQTYQNFEYIIVDDGSNDNSYALCKEYADKDKRIKLIHKENGGVSSARNKGLENIIGDYVLFLDGDDFLQPDLLQVCNNSLNKGEDILQFGVRNCNEQGDFLYEEVYENDKKTITQSDEFINYINNFIIKRGGMIWVRCFKTTIIKDNSIIFDMDLRYFEDTLFSIVFCSFIKEIKNIKYAGYNYRDNKNSCTSTISYKEKANSLIKVAIKLQEFFSTKKINCLLNNCYDIIFSLVKTDFVFGPRGLWWRIDDNVISSLTIEKNKTLNKYYKIYCKNRKKVVVHRIEDRCILNREKILAKYLVSQNKFSLKLGLLKLKINMFLIKIKLWLK